ncbi:5-oxoprolinase subunit B family protein [Gordonia sp. NPDC003376]
MSELPAGPDAVLLDFSTDPDPLSAVTRTDRRLRAAWAVGGLPTLTDIVPSAETVLVQFESGSGIDSLGLRRVLRSTGTDSADADDGTDEIRIPVDYNGEDLAAVAGILDVDVAAVVRMHYTTRWRVQFMGFAPGFGYLVPADHPDHPLTRIGRRDEPRTRVPAGSVAIAAGYSAVYPRQSPGGWNLLGHTDITLWDEDAPTPSTLSAGMTVIFDDVTGRPR